MAGKIKNQATTIEALLERYNGSRKLYLLVDEKGGNMYPFEAFASLCVVFERALVYLAVTELKKVRGLEGLHKKRSKGNYNLDRVLDDLLLLSVISSDEFEQLNIFRRDRNVCFHTDVGDRKVVGLYKKYHPIVEELLERIAKI